MLVRLSLLAASTLALSCGYPPPPAAWTGAPAPTAAPPQVIAPPPTAAPAPPPPPKCEELAENCKAGPDTKLAVGEEGAWFTPPEGWAYARGKTESIAVHPDGTAIIVLAPSTAETNITPTIEAMVSQHGVRGLKADKLKRRLKKAQQTLPAGSGSVDLWEVEKSQQGEALALNDKGNGTLLVLVGKLLPERTLLGFAFVVETAAEAEAPKIMQAVQSLRGQP